MMRSTLPRTPANATPHVRVRRWWIQIVLGVFVAASVAASPAFWRISTQAEFLEGDISSLTIDADGHLGLGPVTDEFFDTTAPVLWSLAAASDGALWAGSGSDGRLYRVTPEGREETIFEADETDIYTISSGRDGAVFAASSPEGRVYRVDRNGGVTTVLEPDATYIWALVVAPNGSLFVGTGDPARIYRVDPDANESEVVFESDATHVLCLALEPSGSLLAGTESPGQVLRIEPEGSAFVLLDTPYDEIRTLRLQPDGAVIAVAVAGQKQGTTSPTAVPTPATVSVTPSVSVTTSVTALVSSEAQASQSSGIGNNTSGTGEGAVYRIAPDGLWDRLWSSDTDAPYDAIIDATGALLVGTGPKGKIYRVINDPPRTILLGRAPARQITRFLEGADGAVRYATANPGKVVQLTSALASRGVYVSAVRDAETVAKWGTISWRGSTPGGSRIELASRSGNTEIPNATWSDWSAPYADGKGSLISSPNARYLQWRATLIAGDASPRLTSVTAAYLPRNLRPEVTKVTVHPPGTVFLESFSSGDPALAGLEEEPTSNAAGSARTLGRQSYRKGLQTFVWEASDANGDTLRYTVSFQPEGQTLWQTLQADLVDSVFAWDTTLTPDGAYRIKIVATDAPDNSPQNTLVGQRESPVFDIDNSAPRVEILGVEQQGDQASLAFHVSDTHSPIRHVEIREGTGPWRVVYPTDGIPDGLLEEFLVSIVGDENSAVIRATDALANTVTVSGR